jgi:excisionase family DNA binding protein
MSIEHSPVRDAKAGGLAMVETPRVRITPDGRMTRAHAAVYLGVKKKTLEMWAIQGRGPRFIKIGGRVFYRLDELDRFISASE